MRNMPLKSMQKSMPQRTARFFWQVLVLQGRNRTRQPIFYRRMRKSFLLRRLRARILRYKRKDVTNLEPWIKLYKKFTDWQWYGDINVKVVFLHLLLTANWKAKKWQGISIEPGELVTSYQNLAEETGLSVQRVRNAIQKLQKTHSIEKISTNRYTLLKIVNYRTYQAAEIFEEQSDITPTANESTTGGNQSATIKEYKYNKYKKSNIYTSPKRKNQFQDYDNDITDMDIKIMKERISRKNTKEVNL